jgi:molybdopterin/thiamine biosynthesis adenylyltransferase
MANDQDIPFGWRSGYAATILNPNLPEDAQQIRRIRDEVIGLEIHDQIESQLCDLIKLLYPKKPLTDAEYRHHIEAKLNGIDPANYGNWVYYPWRRSLVHLLPQEEFVRIRTIRNAYKITFEEQAKLATKKVGIIGLSVGQSAALAVAIERAAGEIRIADFDTLELSNLNRIRSSVINLGLPKTHMVAREIAELDPYLPVRVFEEGINEHNIEAFLMADSPLDLLIEECDSVDIKVLAREHARRHRIPVLMDTSDRGMIDVERYDLDPNYPILHGLIDPSVDFAFLKTLKTSEEKLPYIAPILGIDTMSIRLRASALEVGQSISTWPQLGGDVMHGGALCVHHAKEILLGRSIKNFRSFESPLIEKSWEKKLQFSVDSDVQQMNDLDSFGLLSIEEKEAVKNAIAAAPSAGNLRQWIWKNDGADLIGSVRVYAPRSSGDVGQIGSYISLGACLENVTQTLGYLGYPTVVKLERKNDFHSNVRVQLGTKGESEQNDYDFISLRKTNRSFSNSYPIDANVIKEIIAGQNSALEILFIDERDKLTKLGGLLGRTERLRFTDPLGHQEFYDHEVNWSNEEAIEKGFGLNIEHFDLSPKKKVGMQLSSNPEVIEMINSFGGGEGFTSMSEDYFKEPAPIILMHAKAFNHETFIEGGRGLQRLWLNLTRHGLDLHPMPAIQFMCAHLYGPTTLTENKLNDLKEIYAEYKELIGFTHEVGLLTLRVVDNVNYKHRAYRTK